MNIKHKHFYHISLQNLGKKKKFHPKIPLNRYEGAFVKHPYALKDIVEDDTIPRICVAPEIDLCISAITLPNMSEKGIRGYVYVADKPLAVSEDLPKLLVPDAYETQEHWILSPTVMKRIGIVQLFERDYDVLYSWLKRDVENIEETMLEKIVDRYDMM